MRQPQSVTLIFPLSPCIIVIDTFAQRPISLQHNDRHISTDCGGQAKPIRVLSVPLTSSQSNYKGESSQSLSLFQCVLFLCILTHATRLLD